MSRKGAISNLLRKFNLIYMVDWLRFYIQRYKNRLLNQEFKKQHPDIPLPPDYLMYESFQLNYKKYFTESKDTARWLLEHLSKHIKLQNLRILDWGCGPGRLIRHLPDLLGKECFYYGTDYNHKSIEWCKKNLPGIEFNNNTLKAELPYPDNYFGVIYGISIFTHLSEDLHHAWYSELYRVLQDGGIMFLTTQGDNFKTKLDSEELKKFEKGTLIVRGNVKEGHRTYSAFHPKNFMKEMFQNADILEHIEMTPEKGKWLPQDIWIIRKRSAV